MINGIIDSGQKIITDGLVLHLDAAQLRSYPGSGTTWTDLSGNGNNGTLTNGPTFNSGNGGSILFDGVNDYVTVPSSTSVNFTGNFTISLWVYLISRPTFGNIMSFVSKYNVGADAGGYDLRIRNNFGPNQIGIVGTDSNGYEVGSDINYTFPILTWTYLTAFMNGTTNQIYINTNSIGSVNNSIAIDSNTKPLNIGRFGEFQETVLTRYLNSNIGMLKMYNRALSATEISQNYNATKSRFGL